MMLGQITYLLDPCLQVCDTGSVTSVVCVTEQLLLLLAGAQSGALERQLHRWLLASELLAVLEIGGVGV